MRNRFAFWFSIVEAILCGFSVYGYLKTQAPSELASAVSLGLFAIIIAIDGSVS